MELLSFTINVILLYFACLSIFDFEVLFKQKKKLSKVYQKSKSRFIKVGNIATLETITCKKAKNKGQLTSKGVISNKGNYAKGMVMKISFVKHELITLVYVNNF